ncbi:MAG: ferritin-like domain-containing protein, partial [Chitinophagia bacterium]|nr:ferritin-like domain-containing protein [Chitinophagia bacterium]
MNILQFLEQIQQADPATLEQPTGRRELFKSFGSKVAAAAVPVALGAAMQPAAAKTTASVADSLNFILQLEYLAYNFYHTAMSTGSNATTYLVPEEDRPGFQTIEDQQMAHITFLRTTLKGMGVVPFTPKYYTSDPVTGNPYSPASYDFTCGGKYPIYTNYDLFLQFASAFEDIGTRAY